MIPALGRALILLSLLASTCGAVLGFAAGRSGSERLASLSRKFGFSYAASMVGAGLLMVFALLRHDFSVSYVAQVGSREVPTWVTVVSLMVRPSLSAPLLVRTAPGRGSHRLPP